VTAPLVGLVTVLGVVSACATTPVSPPPPVIRLQVDDVGPQGAACGATLQMTRGARPANSRVVATVVVSADRPVPLEDLEQVLTVAALRRCATGLAVLRAAAADGAVGYLDAHGEAWEAMEPSAVGAGEAPPPAPHVDW
jgi:hypothetical protein